MMVFLIIIILFFLFVAGLLFLPTILLIDTDNKLASVSIPGYFKAYLSQVENRWRFRFRILFLTLRFDYKKNRKKAIDKIPKKAKKKRKKLTPARMLPALRKFITSIKIRKLKANIDTGDFPLNAQLIAIVSQFNRSNIAIGINFEDKNSFYLKAVTHIYKLLWILIRYILFN